MNRGDRARRAGARDLHDLGVLVIAWLRGEVRDTPVHCGGPAPETTPLIPVLVMANWTGLVTDNSEAAGAGWGASVSGFTAAGDLAALRAAVAGTPLVMTQERARQRGWRCCPGYRDWVRYCPGARTALAQAWYVTTRDPEPGRSDRLWPALRRFADTRTAGT